LLYAFTVFFKNIKKGVDKTAFVAKHNPRLDAFVISGLLDNQYLNFYTLDDDLLQAAKTLKDQYIDSLLEFDYHEKKELTK